MQLTETETPDSSSSAARKLGIPVTTLCSFERQGKVPPFPRDAAGRRLIYREQYDALSAYIASRRKLAA